MLNTCASAHDVHSASRKKYILKSDISIIENNILIISIISINNKHNNIIISIIENRRERRISLSERMLKIGMTIA